MSVSAPGLASDLDVLEHALQALQAHRQVALATIVGLAGPFSRPLGAQLSILESGSFVGSISGGCLETALAEEAKAALEASGNRMLRYGEGSPFIDVRLPCGGSLDIFVDAHPDQAALEDAVRFGRSRRTFFLDVDTRSSGSAITFGPGESGDPACGVYRRVYRPVTRIVLAGRGWEIVALSQLASEVGHEVCVLSQEAATLEYCRPFADQLIPLRTPAQSPEFQLDEYSAFVCLFHEHEWEVALLERVLASDAFYVGALGSRETSAKRITALRERGVAADSIERLHGPIGLFHAQSPRALAVSALAEIMSTRTV